MKNALQKILTSLISVPEAGSRRSGNGILSAKFLLPELDVSREADYLVYRLAAISMKLVLLIAAAFLIDVGFELNIIINSQQFNDNRTVFPIAFSRIIRYPLVILFLIFYFRIRMSLDMSSCDIPVLAHPALFDDKIRSRWIKRSSFVLIMLLLVLLNSYKAVAGISHYTRIDDHNSAGTIVITILVGASLAVAPSLAVIYSLTLEKSYRHFEDFKRQLDRLAKERDAKTDKYKKINGEP